METPFKKSIPVFVATKIQGLAGPVKNEEQQVRLEMGEVQKISPDICQHPERYEAVIGRFEPVTELGKTYLHFDRTLLARDADMEQGKKKQNKKEKTPRIKKNLAIALLDQGVVVKDRCWVTQNTFDRESKKHGSSQKIDHIPNVVTRDGARGMDYGFPLTELRVAAGQIDEEKYVGNMAFINKKPHKVVEGKKTQEGGIKFNRQSGTHRN